MPETELYDIRRWGEGYFDVNAQGHVVVRPSRDSLEGDLFELVNSLVERGIEAPMVIRFDGIIRNRIRALHSAFDSAIREFNYRSSYRMAYPIKVNPQRHVVEVVQQTGREFFAGLEVGSKPELIAVMTLENNSDSLLLCNGYKDAEYIELALMANKLGRKTIIIIEQMYELKLVFEAAHKLDVEPQLGLRMKLSSKGTGKWQSSGGENSKFGLSADEIASSLNQLQRLQKTHWIQLLHFHMGSQITSIESIKKALDEGARMYTELSRECPALKFFDVGGGLAIDYDGSKSIADSSMNYTVEEYARDVVSSIGDACLAAGVPDPVIITESGRAIVAHHSVLITEVIDVASNPDIQDKLDILSKDHDILRNLIEMDEKLSLDNCRETYHDAVALKERILEEFVYGSLKLKERAQAEKALRLLLAKIYQLFQKLPEIPEERKSLEESLQETYFCNFSVFQSLPDSWAIGQLFPIMPIHRLEEKPGHKAILADLSCDSDGKINAFIGRPRSQPYLPLHQYAGSPYYLGIFIIGAYQEILGDLHNLFGDTNVVHAELNESGQWECSRLVEGDTIEEVLSYVQYHPEKLMDQLHRLIENALKSGQLTPAESAPLKKRFKQSMESYTYLVV